MEFNPDRWRGTGRANTGGAESNYASLTFLHGPRSCIGKDFAKAEFACLVAALVGAFEMELEDKDWELKIGGAVTARPKGGLRVVLTPVGEGEKA
ncbi:cytochrome P450 [Sporormia fimetaria CBS 119925]|uniref:Cytochrome P450 n=1 Tax=Sporormia fimetaria CBS 119925 TaxID=1340428 RepID=A0A6A6V9J5_9PLEO|nr:cytochrome P450 [Sporormia fimetaria CBS 119925]